MAGIVAIYGLEGMRRHVDFSADGGYYHVCNSGFHLDHIGVLQLSDQLCCVKAYIVPFLLLERAACDFQESQLSAKFEFQFCCA